MSSEPAVLLGPKMFGEPWRAVCVTCDRDLAVGDRNHCEVARMVHLKRHHKWEPEDAA